MKGGGGEANPSHRKEEKGQSGRGRSSYSGLILPNKARGGEEKSDSAKSERGGRGGGRGKKRRRGKLESQNKKSQGIFLLTRSGGDFVRREAKGGRTYEKRGGNELFCFLVSAKRIAARREEERVLSWDKKRWRIFPGKRERSDAGESRHLGRPRRRGGGE